MRNSKTLTIEIMRLYPVFPEDQDKDDPEFIPPTPQVTNTKRKLYLESKAKYSKKRKIQTNSNENASKEEDDSSDYSDIESQCSFDKHLKFGKSYFPGH